MFYFDDGKTLTVFFQTGESAVWKSDNSQYKYVQELCKNSNFAEIEILHNTTKAIMQMNVEITDDSVNIKYDDKTIPLNEDNQLVKLITILKEKGVIDKRIQEIKPFLKKVIANQFINAAEELYDFFTAGDFEITKSGNILAYKNVNKDLSSIHDNGQTKHVIGEYTEVKLYCTDRNQTCAEGLHFCSKGYLSSYSGDTTIIVEIDPRDVVSIPTDYNFMKGRCRKYKTIGVIGNDGSLNTTNIEAMTDGKTEVVKSEQKQLADQKEARQNEHSVSRIQQTVDLMSAYNNDADKVASIMNISVSTVKRNIRKYNAKEKNHEE